MGSTISFLPVKINREFLGLSISPKQTWKQTEQNLKHDFAQIRRSKNFEAGNKLLTIVNLAALILLRFKLQEMQLTFWNFPSQQRYPPCCKLQRAGKCKHNLVTLRSWKNYKYLSPYSPFLKRIILRELLFCTTWIGNGTKCKSHVQVKIVLLIKRTAFNVFFPFTNFITLKLK